MQLTSCKVEKAMSSSSITQDDHKSILSDLKKRYKEEALKACEKKYIEGIEEGKRLQQSSTGTTKTKNRAHEEAALVSKITSKLKSKYKAEALRACELKYEEGRQSMKTELSDIMLDKKKAFKQAVVDARAEAERERSKD